MTEVRNGFQPTQPKPTIQTIPKAEGVNGQCKSCIHSCVCAYKGHYEDAVELYEKAKNECGKYPYFVCEIRCIKYLKKVEAQESEDRYEDSD